MQRFKTFIVALSAVFMPLALVGASAVVGAADINNSLCQGANLQLGSDADCSPDGDGATETVNSTVETVINFFSWVVGVVSVIMIIWGGFKYITSGGDSSNVTAAKNTILYAIVGLIIVALAQIIVKFVLGTVAGQTQ